MQAAYTQTSFVAVLAAVASKLAALAVYSCASCVLAVSQRVVQTCNRQKVD